MAFKHSNLSVIKQRQQKTRDGTKTDFTHTDTQKQTQSPYSRSDWPQTLLSFFRSFFRWNSQNLLTDCFLTKSLWKPADNDRIKFGNEIDNSVFTLNCLTYGIQCLFFRKRSFIQSSLFHILPRNGNQLNSSWKCVDSETNWMAAGLVKTKMCKHSWTLPLSQTHAWILQTSYLLNVSIENFLIIQKCWRNFFYRINRPALVPRIKRATMANSWI